ncbi:hypothetical protein AVEN_238582-1 [Araneus ventricosus]|uniref:Uncharacterized protein n=1 Tax=Araneus ventricosus TaxID=182803 RepID=A0A4Y2P2I7_ARAVE|nr:hypothetical protein AVEN_238582-1 [Araneus ventricosus]
MTVTLAVDAYVLFVHASSKKKDIPMSFFLDVQLSHLVKQNRRQTVAIQCRSKRKCFGTHSSEDTVGYATLQQTSHSCSFIDQAPSSTTPTVGPGASRLDHG